MNPALPDDFKQLSVSQQAIYAAEALREASDSNPSGITLPYANDTNDPGPEQAFRWGHPGLCRAAETRKKHADRPQLEHLAHESKAKPRAKGPRLKVRDHQKGFLR